jgi:hypothetical protein
VRWENRGLLLPAPPRLPWAHSHAALPIPEPLADGRLRLYFSTRDAGGRSSIACAEVDLAGGGEASLRPDPVFAPGPLGAFDDSGATTSCLLHHEGRQYLYYSGWSLGVTVPFYFQIGCAVSEDEGRTFTRVGAAPLLDRSEVDPYLTASPWILVEDGRLRMWYVSGTGWDVVDGKPRHRYHIKYAESEDGLSWQRDGRVCIDYRDDEEYAIARPCVVRDGDRYRMWFCARGETYRFGYAESSDGLVWDRRDEGAGPEPSADGFDSEMQAYPAVFDHLGERHMLYNGNGYGQTGIGHAVLVA